MKLLPEQFYSLTIREYALMCKGYVDERNEKMENYAWICCNLINVHLGKRDKVKMSDLLPSNDKAGIMQQELKKTASDPYYKEQSIMKLLEANSGKFNS